MGDGNEEGVTKQVVSTSHVEKMPSISLVPGSPLKSWKTQKQRQGRTPPSNPNEWKGGCIAKHGNESNSCRAIGVQLCTKVTTDF